MTSSACQRSVLDPRRLRQARERAGLTQRAVARTIGVSSAVISRIEDEQANHGDLNLRLLQRLGAAYGVNVPSLFRQDQSECQPAHAARSNRDAAKLEAVLMEIDSPALPSALASAFTWTLARLQRAASELDQSLKNRGQRLVRRPAGWTLEAEPTFLDADEVLLLHRAGLERREMRINQARLLVRVIRGEITKRWAAAAGNADRVTLASLQNAGLIAFGDERYELTGDAAFSLGIDLVLPASGAGQRP